MQVNLRIKPFALRASPLTGRLNFGFSLVELLVVISIIAVLSAVLVTNFMGMRERARDAQKIQDLNAIKNALRMYYNDNQSYPANGSLDSSLVPRYMPSFSNIGYNYSQVDGGDGFILGIDLEAGAGDEDVESQVKCGVGTTVDKVFTVCAN